MMGLTNQLTYAH